MKNLHIILCSSSTAVLESVAKTFFNNMTFLLDGKSLSNIRGKRYIIVDQDELEEYLI